MELGCRFKLPSARWMVRALSCCNAVRAVKRKLPLGVSVEALPLRLHQGRSEVRVGVGSDGVDACGLHRHSNW